MVAHRRTRDRCCRLDQVASASSLGVYAASPRLCEVDVSGIASAALAANKGVFYPRVMTNSIGDGGSGDDDHHRPPRMLFLSPDDGMEPSSFGISEPVERAPRAPGDGGCALDVIIVPGLAFDRRCGRLGRGGGFYDAFFERCAQWTSGGGDRRRPYLVGVCFEEQIVSAVVREGWDVPVDVVVTPSAVFFHTGGVS